MSTTKINGLEFQNNFCKCTSSSNTTAHVAKLCINALRGDVLIFTLSCKTSIDALGGRLRTVILWLFCRGKMNIFVVMSEFYYYAWRFQGWMGGLGRKHQFDVLRGNLNMDVALTEKFASGKPAQRTMRLFLPTWIFIVKVKNKLQSHILDHLIELKIYFLCPKNASNILGFRDLSSHTTFTMHNNRDFMTPYSIQFNKVAFDFKSLFNNFDIDIFNQFSNF